jgi:hypothetical protein
MTPLDVVLADIATLEVARDALPSVCLGSYLSGTPSVIGDPLSLRRPVSRQYRG